MASPQSTRAAADVLNRVLDVDVANALCEGFLKDDLIMTGVVPLPAAANTNPCLATAVQQACVEACVDSTTTGPPTSCTHSVSMLLERGGRGSDAFGRQPRDDARTGLIFYIIKL